jgi:nicotinamidase/pyrazinamidase
MKRIELLCIDPQNSFCSPFGELYVKGADKDMERLATMVKRIGPKLHDIHVTLDSHHPIHVAHPIFWKDSSGKHPSPFTIISVDDVKNGKWITTLPSLYKRALSYVEQLAANGRYPLCIWPPHCLISSAGHALYKPLFDALVEWENEQFAVVDYVTKGSNPYTEHYSVFGADCADPSDPSTQLNTKLINTLMDVDILAIAGEAGSHCLANSARDLVLNASDDEFIKKIVLLEDATSPVPGFEKFQEDFIKEMTAKGMQISNTKDFLA